jgi:hypothetical protein
MRSPHCPLRKTAVDHSGRQQRRFGGRRTTGAGRTADSEALVCGGEVTERDPSMVGREACEVCFVPKDRETRNLPPGRSSGVDFTLSDSHRDSLTASVGRHSRIHFTAVSKTNLNFIEKDLIEGNFLFR